MVKFLMKPIVFVVRSFHKWRLKEDLKIAIKHAKSLRYNTHKKYMVLYLQGGFKVVEKQKVKQLIQQGGYFRKGVNMKTVEQSAYYITD